MKHLIILILLFCISGGTKADAQKHHREPRTPHYILQKGHLSPNSPFEIDKSNPDINFPPSHRKLKGGEDRRQLSDVVHLPSSSQFDVVDTAVVRTLFQSSSNISRRIYSYTVRWQVAHDVGQSWTNGQWVNSWRDSYTYDVNGNWISKLQETWSSGQWLGNWRYTSTYDSNGNTISESTEYLSNGLWVNYEQFTYAYDINGNRLSWLYRKWFNGQWVNSKRITSTYDSIGNKLSELAQPWSNGQWMNQSLLTYTYDLNNNTLSILSELWSGGQWENSNRYTNTYNINGKILSVLFEIWSGGQWINRDRASYTYNINGSLFSRLKEVWSNGQWVDESRYSYTYNVNGSLSSELKEIWSGHWVNQSRFSYTYDVNWNPVIFSSDEWSNGGWIPVNSDFWVTDVLGNKFSYYCYNGTLKYKSTTTNIGHIEQNLATEYVLSQNYPNPFNPTTAIGFSLLAVSNVTLKVYDILGKEVATLIHSRVMDEGKHEVEFDASNLPSGMYFYKLTANNFSQVKKMQVLK